VIATDEARSSHETRDRGELAELLSDQFAVLDDTRPTEARALDEGDLLIFTFVWPLRPADELLIASGRDEGLATFRAEFLRIIAPSLANLVELDLHREVTSSAPSLGDDTRHASFSFALGARKSLDRETMEALRNWGVQRRRKARDERSALSGRREELRRLHEEIRGRISSG
jgi:hypothetical protein